MKTTGSSFSLSNVNRSEVALSWGPSSPALIAGCGSPNRISGPQYARLTPGTGPGSM